MFRCAVQVAPRVSEGTSFRSKHAKMVFSPRMTFPRCACLTAAILTGCTHPATESKTAPPPLLRPLNVVVVTIDTLRPDHLRCYGYSKIETPNVDSIAQAGVLFENAVTQTPLTPPSHASIFTGLYPT